MVIAILYAVEFGNIQSNYVNNASGILIGDNDESFNVMISKFVWEYRGLEIIIIAFILLGIYAGISAQIRRVNNKG